MEVCVLWKSGVAEMPDPVVSFTRDGAGVNEFWSATTPVFGKEVKFSPTKAGPLVRVQLYPYLTRDRRTCDIFGLGVEIGMAASLELRKHTQDVPKAAVLVLGTECTELPADGCYRCYIGVAFRTK